MNRSAGASAAQTAMLTGCAIIAFAANSILCRLALDAGTIDPASLTIVRVTSGAAMLTAIAGIGGARGVSGGFDWRATAALTGYLVCFSFGYVTTSTATGALLLFGAVQLTMLTAAWRRGARFTRSVWSGFTVALGGLGWLLAPGLDAPEPAGLLLMLASGACWGAYTLSGGSSGNPLAATAANFLAATPLTIAICAPWLVHEGAHWSTAGLVLGVASGAIASACGYAVWFAALRRLNTTQAAVVQLSVPVIAGAGGLVLLAEPLEPRLLVAGCAILGGIALVLSERHRA